MNKEYDLILKLLRSVSTSSVSASNSVIKPLNEYLKKVEIINKINEARFVKMMKLPNGEIISISFGKSKMDYLKLELPEGMIASVKSGKMMNSTRLEYNFARDIKKSLIKKEKDLINENYLIKLESSKPEINKINKLILDFLSIQKEKIELDRKSNIKEFPDELYKIKNKINKLLSKVEEMSELRNFLYSKEKELREVDKEIINKNINRCKILFQKERNYLNEMLILYMEKTNNFIEELSDIKL